MYQALYRKYRPQQFSDVVGQKVIVKTLCNAILYNKISHAYLFTGPRGTGKTSIAKIFAKTINCQELTGFTPCNKCISCMQFANKQTVDVFEIDAASNNGVEEIRELKNKVSLVPTNSRYKVYIIDEVHMLTTAAFNAMLKTLEEPPKNVVFILATTEPHKIPLTILSRCQRFDFKKLSNNEIVKRLNYIVEQENIKVEDGVLEMIASISNGGMRDSIGFLDQLITYCDEIIKIDDVHEINGSVNNEQIFNFVNLMLKRKYNEVYELITKFNDEGKNLSKILECLIDFLKNILIYINCPGYFKSEEENKYEHIYEITNESELNIYIDNLLEIFKNIKYENNKKMIIELGLIKIFNIIDKRTEKVIEKTSNVIERQEVINKGKNGLDEQILTIKKIRINNTLARFNKKELIELKNNIHKVMNFSNIQEYSSIISLIMDGELKARGKNNLIFVYNSETLEQYFNSELLLVENVLKETFNVNFHVIAVNAKEWEFIKNDFNNSIKNNVNKYVYQEENFSIDEIFKISNNDEKNVKNDIDNLFAEIVEYN